MDSHGVYQLQLQWIEAPYAVLDVESNGQRPPEPVEIGIVTIDAGVTGTFRSWFVRPNRRIISRVSRILRHPASFLIHRRSKEGDRQ